MPLDMSEVTDLVKGVEQKLADLRGEVDGKAAAADVVEKTKIRKMETDLGDAIKKLTATQAEAKAQETRLGELEAKLARGGGGGVPDAEADEHKDAFVAYLRDPHDRQAETKLFDIQKKAAEVRVATSASGGYAVPEVIATEIAMTVQDVTDMRAVARVVQVGSSDYKELLDRNGFGTEWVGETAPRNQTSTADLAEVVPTMGTLAAKPQATVESLEDLFFDVPAWLVDSASRQYAIAEGAAFISGDGKNKPTGLLNGTPVATDDASRAFGTLQYVPTGVADNLSGNPFDEMMDLLFTLKSGYRGAGFFMLNSGTMAALAKVKDGDGRYLLSASLTEGVPFTILGRPVVAAEDMPDIAADAFPIAFGDFQRGYLIVDRIGFRIVRDEVTRPGYVRWVMSKRVGGRTKDTNAIKLLKCAVS